MIAVAAVVVSSAVLIHGCAGTTDPATDVTASSAQLNGHGSTGSVGATIWYDYGTTTSYGRTTPPDHVPANISNAPYPKVVKGLDPSTTYHFRLCGRDDGSTQPLCSYDQSFTTTAFTILQPDHDGAAVSGDIVLEASLAGDPVVFAIDNAWIGTGTNNPFGTGIAWNSRTVSNGAHLVTAFYVDASSAVVRSDRTAQVSNTFATSYQNPVSTRDAPDPSAIRVSTGYYYAYTTNSSSPSNSAWFPILKSPDLLNWTYLGGAMPSAPPWSTGNPSFGWAPHIAWANGWRLYFVAQSAASGNPLGIGVATSETGPEGPFTAGATPLVAGSPSNPGYTIDPFVLDDGPKTLYWGSGGCISGAPLDADGLQVTGGTSTVLCKDGSQYESGLIEGAWVTKHVDPTSGVLYYYMMVSGTDCCHPPTNPSSNTYGIRVARSTSKLSGFGAHRDLLTGVPAWANPGHNAVVTDGAGRDWIVYHAYARDPQTGAVDTSRRQMLIDPIDWSSGWPVVNDGHPSVSQPSTAPRP